MVFYRVVPDLVDGPVDGPPVVWHHHHAPLSACVTSVSMYAGNTVSGGISQAAAQAQAARKKPKEVDDFYRFQARDKKKNELVELRTKFAAAQQHLQNMRSARSFKGD